MAVLSIIEKVLNLCGMFGRVRDFYYLCGEITNNPTTYDNIFHIPL